MIPFLALAGLATSSTWVYKYLTYEELNKNIKELNIRAVKEAYNYKDLKKYDTVLSETRETLNDKQKWNYKT